MSGGWPKAVPRFSLLNPMIYVDAPDGFEMPEGVKTGQKFEAVATLTIGEDGRICIKELDGVEIGSEKEEDDGDDNKPEDEGFLGNMEKRAEEAGMGRKQMMM